MQLYSFRFCQVEDFRPGLTSALPDRLAAQAEAMAIFADLARDIARWLETNPEWQLEVTDETGKPIFRLRILAESLE